MPAKRRGLVIAAPQSGSGKTVFTLGLLRALKRKGAAIVSAKSGPDYIDPKFHEAATGSCCINLDAWAMSPEAITTRALEHTPPGATLIVEGAMGLFDGSAAGQGSTADLAAHLKLPVVLVVDASKQAQSIAALVHGFSTLRGDIDIAALILNKVGSLRHERILKSALEPLGIPVLGSLSNNHVLSLPSRHLGLVQAAENKDLETFIEETANRIDEEVDISGLMALAGIFCGTSCPYPMVPPLGRHIAVAKDVAFSFIYPHLLNDWMKQDCRISFFSPLGDEAPPPECDAIYLPGGYPELWGKTIASASCFRDGMKQAAERGVRIYGECGGFMVLGDSLVDAEGTSHSMLGLLSLETSFQERRRHLGYRKLSPTGSAPWSVPLNAHEFHYSTVIREGNEPRLFQATDAECQDLGMTGLCNGNVFGSYAHIIDPG